MNGGYYGSLLADPNLASAIKSQHLKEKANAMMSLEMGALGTIGAATGAYYWGPSIVAGAQASWPHVVAGGAAIYKAGERISYRALDFYGRHQDGVMRTIDYLTGLGTPQDPSTRGSIAAKATGDLMERMNPK